MLWSERIESLKAGTMGAIATGGSLLAIQLWAVPLLLHQRLLPIALESPILKSPDPTLGNWASWNTDLGELAFWDFVFKVFVAIASGFLFGVTYRYIIRQDQSNHLRSGAVLAFAFVRGLAQLDQRGLNEQLVTPLAQSSSNLSASLQNLLHQDLLWQELVAAGGLLLESWLLFGFARLLLDWSLSRGWLRAFGTSLSVLEASTGSQSATNSQSATSSSSETSSRSDFSPPAPISSGVGFGQSKDEP